MSDNNSHDPVLTQVTLSPTELEELINHARSIGLGGLNNLASYRSDLNRAVGEYGLGRVEEAKSILGLLSVSLERVLVGQRKKEAAEAHLLYASTLTWLGKTCERLKQNKAAWSAFEEAKAEFKAWIDKPKEPPAHSYRNYGVTLFKLGNYKQALKAFTLANTKGTLDAEGNFYMGVCLQDLDRFPQAEEHFREALKQNPDHVASRKELAGLLERRRRTPEAVVEYRNMILYALGYGFLNEALVITEHTLRLTKQDPQLLGLKGDMLRLQGDSTRALRALNRSLKKEPRNSFANGVKGLLLLELNQKREGIRLLQRALKLDPKNDWVPVELAAALGNSGDYDRSLTVLNKALATDPRNVRALMQKGEILSAINRNPEALAILERAIALKPNDALLLAKQGRILRYLGKTKRALKVLRRSVELDRRIGWVYGELGSVLYSMGQYYEALQAVIDALAIQPDNPFALNYKSEILRMLGVVERSASRTEEALQVINQALAMSPNDPWALGTKGQVLRDLGRVEEAAKILKSSIDLNPSVGWIYLEYSSAQYSLGNYGLALEALEEALRLEDDGEWHVFKAQILCEIGNFKEAVATLDRAVQINRRISTAFGLKGWALQHLGIEKAPDALKAYQSAVKLEPDNLWWHKGIANAFYLMGDRRRASNKYRWVLRRAEKHPQDPGDVSFLSLSGWCHYRLGNYEQAVELFKKVSSISVADIAYQFDLALSLIGCGRYAEAWDEYVRGVRRSSEQPVLRRRGLICVALDDLNVALKRQPRLRDVTAIKDSLRLLENNLRGVQGIVNA
jgi:tetratricopeptide (TPR) repeat protein